MTIRHATQEINEGSFQRDGDLDAVLTVFRVVDSGVPYMFRHSLGRVVQQIQIVWADDYVTFAVVRDAEGNAISDREKIALSFSSENVLVKLRFA